MKNKIKKVLIHLKNHGAFYALISNVIVWTIAYNMITPIFQKFLDQPVHVASIVKEVQAQTPEPVTPKNYMLNRIKEEGLNVKTADCILSHESKYNNNALGVNTNRTADLGYWQINSLYLKHKMITLRCLGDYHCSTEWVIDKVKNDGGWQAWSTYKLCK